MAKQLNIVEPSRAKELGISPKTLRARSLRSIRAARKHLTEAALPFAEIDNSIEHALQDLLGEFDGFVEKLNHSVEWLNLPFGEEP